MEQKARLQKQQVEKTEQYQESELKQMSKRIRSDQVRLLGKNVCFNKNVQFYFINSGKRASFVSRGSETRGKVIEARN
jgi:hypothetical protein